MMTKYILLSIYWELLFPNTKDDHIAESFKTGVSRKQSTSNFLKKEPPDTHAYVCLSG